MMKSKAKKLTALALVFVFVFLMAPITAFAVDYDGHWAYNYIVKAQSKGWITGYTDGSFKPEEVISRGEFAVILWRVLGEPEPEGETGFTDVPEGAWYYDAVTALCEQGILNGYSDGTFRANSPQSREMAFCVLARALELTPTDANAYLRFSDAAQVSGWARSDLSAMIEKGYVQGGEGKLLPQQGLKRGEAAKLFVVIYLTDEENRVVCLAPSMVEIVYALGCGDDIVGWSQYTDYPIEVADREGWVPYGDYEFISNEDELAKDVAVVSGFTDYNAELVALLEPTLILAESGMQYDMYEELKAEGYNVLYFAPESVDDIYDMMIEIGDAMGVGDTARTLVDGYYDQIEAVLAITSKLPKLDVYFEIAHRMYYGDYAYGPYTVGSGTPFSDMIEIAGGVNIFEDLQGDYAQVEYEDIVERNPDIILSPMWPNAEDYEVTTIYEIMTREGFSDTNAVKNSRVLFYDSSLLKRPGPRTITAILKLAYLLHPYYFDNPENSVSPWELGKIDEFYPIPSPLR